MLMKGTPVRYTNISSLEGCQVQKQLLGTRMARTVAVPVRVGSRSDERCGGLSSWSLSESSSLIVQGKECSGIGCKGEVQLA